MISFGSSNEGGWKMTTKSNEDLVCRGTGAAMFKWLKKQIRQDGFGILTVFPTAGEVITEWFHYTIGNHGAGLPEILVIGGDQRMTGPLTDVAKIMRKRGTAFANGELVSLGGKYPVKIVSVSCPEVYDLYTCQVARHYNTENYAVQQMLTPDREGRYADDPQCAEPYASLRLRNRHGTVLSWSHLHGVQSH
jgi:hypothetical protein